MPAHYIEFPQPTIIQGGGGGISGSGGSKQVTIWDNSGTALTGFADFIWDESTTTLNVGSGSVSTINVGLNAGVLTTSGNDFFVQGAGGSLSLKSAGKLGVFIDPNGKVEISGNNRPLAVADPNGNGSLLLGSQTSLGNATNDGFVYIFSASGNPTGVPSLASSISTALYVDTANAIFYFYSGAAWHQLNGGPTPAGSTNDVQLNNGTGGFTNVSGATNTTTNNPITSISVDRGIVTSVGSVVGANVSIAGAPVTAISTTNGIVTGASFTSPVIDGTYTLGLGLTQNGTITTVNGIITAVQQVI